MKKAHHVLKVMGYDVKFIIQSDVETLSEAQEKYPFELIADPEAKLYDRFNVFEADSYINLIAGDKAFIRMTQGNIRNLLDDENGSVLSAAFSGAESTHRELQLCAYAIVEPDMTVSYAYYGKTLSDFPGMTELMKVIK